MLPTCKTSWHLKADTSLSSTYLDPKMLSFSSSWLSLLSSPPTPDSYPSYKTQNYSGLLSHPLHLPEHQFFTLLNSYRFWDLFPSLCFHCLVLGPRYFLLSLLYLSLATSCHPWPRGYPGSWQNTDVKVNFWNVDLVMSFSCFQNGLSSTTESSEEARQGRTFSRIPLTESLKNKKINKKVAFGEAHLSGVLASNCCYNKLWEI